MSRVWYRIRVPEAAAWIGGPHARDRELCQEPEAVCFLDPLEAAQEAIDAGRFPFQIEVAP